MLKPRGTPHASTTGFRTGGLSPELLSQSAGRLRVLALLYAFTFFMAAVFPNMMSQQGRDFFWGNPENWAPTFTSIAVALAVAAFAKSSRLPLATVMNVGLVFEVVSCYGIALAEYLEPTRLNFNGWIGLSWVAVWAPLFTVVIPTRPFKATLFTSLSLTSVPVVIGFMVLTRRTTFDPAPDQFFFWMVLPYILIAIMAHVGARVVYSLGKAVTEARELGSYRLVERLGQGGMGEVWKAKHRLLARPAAVKLIRASNIADPNSDEVIRRFEREAQVTAGLSSPHTVQLFDFGVADDGSFFYVMELLEGLDLERFVQRYGPMPAERVIYLLRQVCHSLAEAESHGLVHRDIKPANLFLCRYGGEHDFVKVLDFGIAKAIAPDMLETGAIGITQENMFQGTPAYIAPEQVLNGSRVDGRADIYATACVGYFLLTGRPVFTGDTPMAIVVHHAHTPPAAPSQSSELPIPPALDRLILDCLAKSPADRPQSARELSRRLAEVDGARPWSEDRAREWWDTHRPAHQAPSRVASEAT
jgi:serine/threonine-protein kinase